MTEPTIPASVGIVTLAVALLGPMAGPYAVIVLSALAGAIYWPADWWNVHITAELIKR